MTSSTSAHGETGALPATSPFMLLILGLLTALGPLAVDLYLPGLPAIARDLHASDGAAQRTVSVFFLGMALGQLVHGPWSDRIGRRLPLLGGVGLFVIGSIGCALAPSIEALTAMRFVQAIGGCAGVVVARAIVRDRFRPRDTVRIYSTLMLVLAVSPILAPLAGGFILLIADWRALFWLLGALGAALCFVIAFRLPESHSPEARTAARNEGPLASYLSLLANRQVLAFVLIGAFAGSAMPTYISSSPAVLIQGYHVSPQAFGWFFGANGVGLIAASQINTHLSHAATPDVILKIANRFTFAAALIMSVSAMTGVGGLWGVVIPLFFLISSLGFNQANALAGAVAEDPMRAGATAALVGAAQAGVGTVCSLIASLFLDGSARPMALVILGALAIAVTLFALMRPHGHRFHPLASAD